MRKPMWTCWPQWEIRTPTLTQRNSYVYRQWYHRDAVPDLWVEGRSRATEYIVYWGQTILAQWIRLLDPIVDASFHTLWRVDGITIEIPSVISNLSNLTRKIATVVRCWSFWLHIYIYIKKKRKFQHLQSRSFWPDLNKLNFFFGTKNYSVLYITIEIRFKLTSYRDWFPIWELL